MLYAMGQITRLPSNLRPTTRECVHLVTRGHFRSRDKYGGHTIRSAIAEKTRYTQISWLYCHTQELALCYKSPGGHLSVSLRNTSLLLHYGNIMLISRSRGHRHRFRIPGHSNSSSFSSLSLLAHH